MKEGPYWRANWDELREHDSERGRYENIAFAETVPYLDQIKVLSEWSGSRPKTTWLVVRGALPGVAAFILATGILAARLGVVGDILSAILFLVVGWFVSSKWARRPIQLEWLSYATRTEWAQRPWR